MHQIGTRKWKTKWKWKGNSRREMEIEGKVPNKESLRTFKNLKEPRKLSNKTIAIVKKKREKWRGKKLERFQKRWKKQNENPEKIFATIRKKKKEKEKGNLRLRVAEELFNRAEKKERGIELLLLTKHCEKNPEKGSRKEIPKRSSSLIFIGYNRNGAEIEGWESLEKEKKKNLCPRLMAWQNRKTARERSIILNPGQIFKRIGKMLRENRKRGLIESCFRGGGSWNGY